MPYRPYDIEIKWQNKRSKDGAHKTAAYSDKPKFYCLEQFPYPSGNLHMGHMRVYSIGDVIARFMRMNGYNVLHPMGWDSFGLPAENAANKSGSHPGIWTEQNIKTMKRQQMRIGSSYDWDREITTCHPDYYKFNQWIFLKMFEKGLAYRKKAPVNWCNSCKTVLANEQVENGNCWRCSNPVSKKELEQWFLKITDYADRLIADLDHLPEWDERVKTMQKNWIGKTQGFEIDFPIFESDEVITVFTTRPNTINDVSFLVLAPEHLYVQTFSFSAEALKRIQNMRQINDMDRSSYKTKKEGVFSGVYAIHPLSKQKIPVFIGNYVLGHTGTGAIMGVPATDERDLEFASTMGIAASKFSLEKEPNPDLYARKKIQYRLRDWLVSRQRYWGTPIPIIYCDFCGTVPVTEDKLPVILPEDVTFNSQDNPLLSSEAFVHVTCPRCQRQARRETDTMDTFVDSSWYFLRYTDPENSSLPFAPDKANSWLAVDEYVGGIEHAILHLLYSRFFTKFLYDEGMVKIQEPFKKLLAQGMVLKNGSKMSKSKGNVVSPEDIITKYGADTCRLFILFAAPPETDLEWNDEGVKGCYNFLNKFFVLIELYKEKFVSNYTITSSDPVTHKLHVTIKKVTDDIQRRKFNTAISSIMELVNTISENKHLSDSIICNALEHCAIMLSPFVPHIAEEVWEMMKKTENVYLQAWPVYNEQFLEQDEIELVIQVNSKIVAHIRVKSDAEKQEILSDAENVISSSINTSAIEKSIYVPKRLINFITKKER